MLCRYFFTSGLLLLSHLLAFGQTNITDIQEVNTQGSSDASPLLGRTVTVRGVVTASAEADNLGIVYIQQTGVSEWGGIRVNSGDVPSLLSLVVGHRVVVTGRVSEQNGRTGLDNVQIDSIQGMEQIEPVVLTPNVFTSYSLSDNERYESMLVRLAADGELIRVVNVNADGPSNNFGEWRVGIDPQMPDVGCRILTGRVTSSISSSLNVSFINNEAWATNSGILQVDPVVITTDSAFQSITGIVDYSSGNLKLLPRNNADFVPRGGTVSTNDLPEVINSSRLYPNPVATFATIELNLKKPSSFGVELYDVNGRLVRQLIAAQLYQSGDNAIALPFLGETPQGSYFLRIFGPEGMVVLPMLKQ